MLVGYVRVVTVLSLQYLVSSQLSLQSAVGSQGVWTSVTRVGSRGSCCSVS